MTRASSLRFPNKVSFDTGDTLQLSCFQAIDNSSAGSVGTATASNGTAGLGQGIGFSNGVWYLYQLASSGIAMYGSSDLQDNVDMWFAIGTPAQGAAQAAAEASGGNPPYQGSTGIVQIISKPSLGLIALSMVGNGMGPACGSQLMMNASTLYFEGNVNNYGSCTATDYATASAGDQGFNPTLVDVKICVDVSGTTLSPTADMSDCVKSGLITLDSAGNVVSPFAAVGLKHLDADVSATAAGEIYARAWMASTFMNGTDLSAVVPAGVVPLAPAQTVTVAGYTSNTLSLSRKTTAVGDAAGMFGTGQQPSVGEVRGSRAGRAD